MIAMLHDLSVNTSGVEEWGGMIRAWVPNENGGTSMQLTLPAPMGLKAGPSFRAALFRTQGAWRLNLDLDLSVAAQAVVVNGCDVGDRPFCKMTNGFG